MADAFDSLSEEDKADLRKRLDAMSKSAPKTPPPNTSKGPRIRFKKPEEPKDIPANTPEDGPNETPKDIALPDDEKDDKQDKPDPAAEPVDEFADVPVAELDDDEQAAIAEDKVHDEEEQDDDQEPLEPGDAKDNEAHDEIAPPEDKSEPDKDDNLADLLRIIIEKLEKIDERVEAVEALMVELPKIVDDLMRVH